MENSSASIIGGADKPTGIVLSGNLIPAIIGAAVIAVMVAGIIILFKRKK